MLSDLEKKRLEEREACPPRVRAANDDRAKKKLKQWLNDAPDVIRIFNSIPGDRLTDHLDDEDAYRLLTIAEMIMVTKEFSPIEGDPLMSEIWTAKIGADATRPATDNDIKRSVFIDKHISDLKNFLGDKNPVPDAIAYAQITEDPKFKDRFSDAERAGAKASGERLLRSLGK